MWSHVMVCWGGCGHLHVACMVVTLHDAIIDCVVCMCGVCVCVGGGGGCTGQSSEQTLPKCFQHRYPA